MLHSLQPKRNSKHLVLDAAVIIISVLLMATCLLFELCENLKQEICHEQQIVTSSFLQLDNYKSNLLKEVEDIVLTEFPKKVLEFNSLLEVCIQNSGCSARANELLLPFLRFEN